MILRNAFRWLVQRRCSSSAAVQLTKDRYPGVERGRYSHLEDRHVQTFEAILGPSGVVTDPDDVEPHNVGWLRTVRGYSRIVLKPRSAEEVSQILRVCNEERLAVCPQGGNTGLVGGSVPVFDEVILSTSLMNKVISIDPLAGTVACEAGCVLEAVNSQLEGHGLMMPYDLGAKGSCQIGGNISTCAGGLRLIRYGTMQANLLGIQAVLANGDILDCMNHLRKDNTGYHLRQFFVGAEGTLGIVTGAVILCPVKPNSVSIAFLGLKAYPDVLSTMAKAKRALGEILSSCELMDDICMRIVMNKLGLRSPLESEHKFYMLIETHGSDPDHDQEKMNNFLEQVMDEGLVQDGTMATEPSRINALWDVRERIIEALLRDHYVYKYDISLPYDKFYEVVGVVEEHLKGTSAKTVSGFGHLGDGNLHLNVQSDSFDPEVHRRMEPFIFDWTWKNGGSISAEHGIGFKKAGYLRKYAKSPEAVRLMESVKKSVDPNGILNPYKVLV